ncbi:choice-of-anchor I family protein [Marinimicrobium sp. ARAG 43.8]|uniref:choice-of-anchor I family protein n=1 Tax=Marinimicrobium sp. ARAG 43.8 TaxID=3418719 RepID=UPI003CEBC55E
MLLSYLRLFMALLLATTLIACASDNDNNDVNDNTPDTEQPDDTDDDQVVTPSGLTLKLMGRHATGQFDESAAEVTAFHAGTQRAFVVNALAGAVDVLDMSDPAAPEKIDTIDATGIEENSVVNSVAVHGDLIAVAVEAPVKTDNGYVAIHRADTLERISFVEVGALPDMVTFTPDGQYILTANEGEPSDDYSVDPEGSISIVGISDLDDIQVRTADFHAFNDRKEQLLADGVRIFGPNASVAQDLEPEYIAVSADSQLAFVSLQENNALARVDIESATVTDILPLGYKQHWGDDDFFGAGRGLDVSDEDGEINISNEWAGLYGMYHPDAIAAYDVGGQTYIVTANEGDARAWGEDNQAYWDGDTAQGFVEEIRVKHLVHSSGFERRVGDDMPAHLAAMAKGALLNPETFAYCGATAGDPGDCREDEMLGRLNVTWTKGYRQDDEGNPVMFTEAGVEDPAGDWLMYDNLYSFGARSFSIFNAEGERVWDSGDRFEQFLASDSCMAGSERTIPCADYFNSGHDEEQAFDSRSDAKGPEPEGVTLGQIGEKVFAFVNLERMGGIMVYDITDPTDARFVDYYNSRDNWEDNPEDNLKAAGDLGPEASTFIAAEDSPTGEPLLIVGNEVSGTTSAYRIELTFEE